MPLAEKSIAQYIPPTQLDCQVKLRRLCVLNSQLVGDSLDESEQFADNKVELHHVGDVNAAVVLGVLCGIKPSPVIYNSTLADCLKPKPTVGHYVR